MEGTMLFWCVLAITLPLLLKAIWYFNDMVHSTSICLRRARMADKHVTLKLPPGSMGLPFFGETISFLWYFKILRRPDDFIYSKNRNYGEGFGIYRSHLFGQPSIITCSPASNKFVLQSAEDFHSRWPTPELFGHSSLLNVDGKQHVRLRNFVINTINRPNALQRMMLLVQPRLIASLRSWVAKETVCAADEIRKMTFENICRIFASIDHGPLLNEIKDCFEGIIHGLRAFPLNIPGSSFRHAIKCRQRLTEFFTKELEMRRGKKNENNYDGRRDLMDGLMQIMDEDGEQLSDVEVVDNIVTLIIVGIVTTSISMMWALYYLPLSPESLQKLQEENSSIKKGNKEDFMTLDDFHKLKYTSKVVNEIIRLANVTFSIFRTTTRDVEYEGYIIPKGWQVIVWLRSLHTDPKNFDDPLKFKPERWDDPPKPATFQGFGAGHKFCAGNMFAKVQLTMLLHHLSLGYKWELINPNAKISYLPHPRPDDGALMKFSTLE